MRKPRGEITKLSTLFEKYKKVLKAPQGSVIEAFCELTLELYNLTIAKNSVSYNVHTRVLHLRVAGTLKNEVHIHKKEILTHLKGRLGEHNAPKDIL
jgi:predicted DNA-binding protein YlxM (UPF0122 family)